jgi:hypothetical protein
MPGAMAPAYQAMYQQPPAMGAPPPLPGAFNVAAPYYAGINGNQVGPLDGPALKQQAQAGAIRPDTLVWRNGMGAWTKAADVPELAALFAPSGPPPLPGGPPPLPPRA